MSGWEFRKNVVEPVLRDMGMWSQAAENLLVMTAAHESQGFQYREQVGGPALSLYQIEPATLDDLYTNYLRYRPQRQDIVDEFMRNGTVARQHELVHNDRYATAVARMLYARVQEPLPDADDLDALAQYAKTYWNTEAGKASPEKYRDDYERWGLS